MFSRLLYITVTICGLLLEPLRAGQPYIVLTGDSTVTDDAGWGRAFAAMLKPHVTCTNLARGGASSKSFRAIGRWDEALSLGPTIVFIQFGHNDMPGKGPERETDPETSFAANLTRFVVEARAAGATPVLVTSIPRRLFDKGRLRGELAPYAAATRRVASEQKTPLIDLFAACKPELEKRGDAGCLELGPTKDGKPDRTHLNARGARFTAEILVCELRKTAPEIATLVQEGGVPAP